MATPPDPSGSPAEESLALVVAGGNELSGEGRRGRIRHVERDDPVAVPRDVRALSLHLEVVDRPRAERLLGRVLAGDVGEGVESADLCVLLDAVLVIIGGERFVVHAQEPPRGVALLDGHLHGRSMRPHLAARSSRLELSTTMISVARAVAPYPLREEQDRCQRD
jgi:hypothetical protein